MVIYIVWQCLNSFPESSCGTRYVNRIFRSKKDAEEYCEKMNKEVGSRYNSYYIEKFPVY